MDSEALERLRVLEDRMAESDLIEGIDSQWPFTEFTSKRNGYEHETLMRVGQKLGFVKALLDQGPSSASFDVVVRTVDELLDIVSTRARVVLTADEDGSWEAAAQGTSSGAWHWQLQACCICWPIAPKIAGLGCNARPISQVGS